MKFYDKDDEMRELKRIRKLAFDGYSRLIVVTGHRYIGKPVLSYTLTTTLTIAYGG